MKKKLFTLQVFLLIAAFPLYFFAEVNHANVKVNGQDENSISSEQAEIKAKPRLFVILKMPAAPEYQVDGIND